MGTPMGRRRASLAGAGMRLQMKPTPVLAKASTAQGWRGPSKPVPAVKLICGLVDGGGFG